MNWNEIRRRMLLVEAGTYIGAKEAGHNNGEFVRLFQSTIGKAEREPWCMSFVQFNVRKVDQLCGAIDPNMPAATLFASEHCVTVWRKSHPSAQHEAPMPGLVAIWKYGDTENGHTGIVEKLNADGTFTTIEGNTDGSGSREGDGVYRRVRSLQGLGTMKLLGFLDPWP